MIFLVVDHGEGNIEVLSPENYGMDTWGMSTQEGIKKKDDGCWYTTYWLDGGRWLEDTYEEDKLNVLLETTDVSEVLTFILQQEDLTIEKMKKLVEQIKEIFNDSIMLFELMYLKEEENKINEVGGLLNSYYETWWKTINWINYQLSTCL